MSRSFLNGIDLHGTQALNIILQNASGTPGSTAGLSAGQVEWFGSVGYSATYNGTSWVPHDASKLAGVIPMSALTFDPSQRANQTGTQLASTISNLASVVQGYSLSSFAVPTSNINMSGYTLTGIPAATAPGQPLEYQQGLNLVNNAAAGISSKDPVAALSATNISTLSGYPTIDGITFSSSSPNLRVLLTAQTTASQNGAWIVSSGAWTRPATEGSNQELDPGAFWFVLAGGTNYGSTQWRMNTTGTITPGTTSISITQFGATAAYTAGNGLTATGNQFAVNPVAGGGVLATSSGVFVDTTVVARKYAATIGDGSSTTYTVTHNLNTLDVIVKCYYAASPYTDVELDVAHTSTSAVTLSVASALAANSVRVVVLG